MKKQTRRSVFETNSSSMHSISIGHSDTFKFPKSVQLYFGEFGWGYDEFNDAQNKLSYVLTAIQYHVDDIPKYPEKNDNMSWDEWEKSKEKIEYEISVNKAIIESKYLRWLKELLNGVGVHYYPEIPETTSKWNEYGYIDHQSTDVIDEIWSDDENEFKENMKNFIFNPNSTLYVDNDNN